ncbi:hypothetical protein EIP91_008892 [Steccherinum ochraceum]|uniref:MARVEL domain-containing protein n=1 Tax=Steccherinum ochraceum TaxID=92696 RepID=A0A4R0RRS4_9APHY|nr:hypothetical protein EIP91_008892 [Steccherinum ochraceum]
MRGRSRRFGFKTNYHAFLFTLMALTAATELGLTAFLISAGSEVHIWSNPSYHSLLILLCFEATWTLVFSTAYMLWVVDGAVHLLANIAHSVFWLLLTAVLWGTGAGLMHHTRSGGYCPGRAPLSRLVPNGLSFTRPVHELRSVGGRCRQSITVEALGWTEFALCCSTLVVTVAWMKGGKRMFSRDSRTLV